MSYINRKNNNKSRQPHMGYVAWHEKSFAPTTDHRYYSLGCIPKLSTCSLNTRSPVHGFSWDTEMLKLLTMCISWAGRNRFYEEGDMDTSQFPVGGSGLCTIQGWIGAFNRSIESRSNHHVVRVLHIYSGRLGTGPAHRPYTPTLYCILCKRDTYYIQGQMHYSI